MASRKPIKKVSVGLTTGTIAAVVGWVVVHVFHQHFSPAEAAALVGALGVLGHFFGSYLTPFVPEINQLEQYVQKYLPSVEELVAYIKELLAAAGK